MTCLAVLKRARRDSVFEITMQWAPQHLWGAAIPSMAAQIPNRNPDDLTPISHALKLAMWLLSHSHEPVEEQ